MDLTKLFNNVLSVVTKPIKAGTSVTIEWPYKELKVEMIEDTNGTCGCTTPDAHEDKITAVYTNSDNPKNIDGAKAVSKSVTVYLKDDKPLKVLNSKGVLDYNPEKLSISLMFHVSIIP